MYEFETNCFFVLPLDGVSSEPPTSQYVKLPAHMILSVVPCCQKCSVLEYSFFMRILNGKERTNRLTQVINYYTQTLSICEGKESLLLWCTSRCSPPAAMRRQHDMAFVVINATILFLEFSVRRRKRGRAPSGCFRECSFWRYIYILYVVVLRQVLKLLSFPIIWKIWLLLSGVNRGDQYKIILFLLAMSVISTF